MRETRKVRSPERSTAPPAFSLIASPLTAMALAATALVAAALTFGLVAAGPVMAGSGGVSTAGNDQPKGKTAKLTRRGRAIPPRSAPKRVVRVIRAANEIRKKPYKYGGGHGRWRDSGYDCSGAVSYALHGGRFVKSPMSSSGYTTWGRKGKGKWITTYAHGGHMYAVIAGLRWDTSMTPGDGPGWSKQMRSKRGFKVRHPKRF